MTHFIETQNDSLQVCPSFLKEHSYKTTFVLNRSLDKAWEWLNSMDTFTRGQIPPYRVEFVHYKTGEKPTFEPGVFTNHHGPLLSAAGVIGRMTPTSYRDLQYFYGSYVLSFRLIRPTRLQFWLKELSNDKTEVTLQLDSHVAMWFEGIWSWGQKLFWKSFKMWIQRAS